MKRHSPCVGMRYINLQFSLTMEFKSTLGYSIRLWKYRHKDRIGLHMIMLKDTWHGLTETGIAECNLVVHERLYLLFIAFIMVLKYEMIC